MKLREHQSLDTSGARCVEIFKLNNTVYLAIPQLAKDIVADPANMNGGNSDVDVIIYQWQDKQFNEFQRISSHGNEHVSFYELEGRFFLAVASIRSGKQPNFKVDIRSKVYEWQQDQFVEFQSFDTYAAKGCQFFKIDQHHYLAFSEGVAEPGAKGSFDGCSHVYRWDGSKFELFQALPSTWGYDISFFELEGRSFLAIADNIDPSIIYEWHDNKFISFQTIATGGGGRNFCYFTIDNNHYLAIANLLHDSELYRWDSKQFSVMQVFDGVAARSFSVLKNNNETFLFRTNFISGTRDKPITDMDSQIYQWQANQFSQLATYRTSGGTESQVFESDGSVFLVVSNSLSNDVRFHTPSTVYEIMQAN